MIVLKSMKANKDRIIGRNILLSRGKDLTQILVRNTALPKTANTAILMHNYDPAVAVNKKASGKYC